MCKEKIRDCFIHFSSIFLPPIFLSKVILFILWISATSSLGKAAELVLADRGKSEYCIVIAADASPSTKYAAKELQTFLKQISVAELPVVTDRQAATGHEIVLGPAAASRL